MKIIRIVPLFLIIALCSILSVKAQINALTKPVNKMIENYLAVKDALVIGNGDMAEVKAKDLLASVNGFPKTACTPEELMLIGKLEYDSRHISEVNKIDHQREHFASLSINLYALLKAVKVNSTTIYYQYCVMNKKYYLSGSATGKDPYMGMAACSKVKETILPAK